MHHLRFFLQICFSLLLLLGTHGWAASLYLPLNLSPEIEARIERLFVQANMPIIKRPIPVKQVYIALDKVGNSDPALASSVRRYLERYNSPLAITHAHLAGQIHKGENQLIANQRGLQSHSNYNASASAHLAANNWFIVNLSGQTYASDTQKDEFAEGSFLSIGPDYLQVDIGNRPHWMGPFQDSDMLLTTNASATPGVTLSNVMPFNFLGISYEVFLAEMSESDTILSDDRSQRLTGNPRLFGFHLSFQPVQGFALGFNRLMQYGGADRDDSFSSMLNAFFKVKESDNIGWAGNDFGNQLSSVTTRYTFPGRFPIAVYMEYAGEDTSFTSDYHLGNTALMLGLHLPRLTRQLDFTYEWAEWQNGWYTNTNYGDGLRQHETPMGHWGANHRIFHAAVGAQAQTAKLIWDINSGQALTTRWRQIKNADYSAQDYATANEVSLEYAHGAGPLILGVTLTAGENVFSESYSTLGGFIRW